MNKENIRYELALISPPWWLIPSRNIMTATEHIIEDLSYNLRETGYNNIIFSRDKNKTDIYDIEDINNFGNVHKHIKVSEKDITIRRENAKKSEENYNYEDYFFLDYIQDIIKEIKIFKINNIVVFQCLPFCKAIKKALPNCVIAYHIGCNDLARFDNHYNYGYINEERAKQLLPYVDYFLPVSNFLYNGIASRFPVIKNRMIVCTIGIDSNKYYNKHLERNIDVLYCGRIVPEKGLECLLNAAEIIYKLLPDIKISLYGSALGPNDSTIIYEKLRKLSKINIFETIPRKELINIYNNSKIFVYPVIWDEPFGTSVAEALSCGCCVITSNHIGGHHEYLDKIDEFQIFKENNANDLSEKIIKLIMNPDVRLIIQRNNEIAYKKYLKWEHTINVFKLIFKL